MPTTDRVPMDSSSMLADYESAEERVARREIALLLGPDRAPHFHQGRAAFVMLDQEGNQRPVSAVTFLAWLKGSRADVEEQRRLDAIESGYVDTDALGVLHPPAR